MNFRHFAQAFGRTFFGTEGIPAAASIGTPRGGFETFPDASGRQAPPAQLSLVLDGLTSACTQFLQQNIRPVVSLSPETVYAIHSIRLVMTPPTMGLLREIIRMPQPIRDRLARACVQKASGSTAFSLENFYGWSVEGDSLITEGEIVKVLVCNEDGPVTLDFVFDGNFEMGARQRREPPVAVAGLSVAYRFHGEWGEEKGSLNRFPALIGKGPGNDLVLPGTYVSGTHLRIGTDGSGGLTLEDLASSNGTWLDGQRMPPGTPMPVSGHCVLGLGGPAGSDGVAVLHLEPAQPAREEPPSAPTAPGWTGFSSVPHSLPETDGTGAPVVEAAVHSEAPRVACNETRIALPAPGAAATQLAGREEGKTLGRLRIRDASGREQVVTIDTLPFIIGREPRGPGYAADGTLDLVSRQHLCLLRRHGSRGFQVDNPGAGSNGTYRQGNLEGEHFLWDFAEGDAASPAHWITLGSRSLVPGSLQVRLEAVGSRT